MTVDSGRGGSDPVIAVDLPVPVQALRMAWREVLARTGTGYDPETLVAAAQERVRACGLDATQVPEQVPDVLRLAQACERSRDVLAAAGPLLADARALLGAGPYHLILADGAGLLLQVEAVAPAPVPNLFPGAEWRECDAGCNPIGTVLASGLPVVLVDVEHTLPGYRGWVSVGMPVRSADGVVKAVLAMSVPAGQASVHTFAWLRSLAQLAEPRRQPVTSVDERILLSTALQQLPTGILVAEAPSGRLLVGNAQAGRILHHTFTSTGVPIGEVDLQGFHADGRPYESWDWPLSRSIAHAETVRGEEIVVVHRDGARGILHMSSAPIHDAAGQVVAAVAVFDDVTVRRQTEQAVRRSKDYAEQLLSATSVLVVGLDRDGDIRVVNDAAEYMTGYTRAELLGRNWFELLVPRDRYPEVWQTFASWQSRGAIPREFENPILTKDGTERYIVWQNAGLQEHGEPVGTISFGIDVTARRRAEDTLRFLADAQDLLASSLDYDATLPRVAEMAVPRVADVCLVALREPGRRLRILALAATDREQAAAIRAHWDTLPPELEDPYGIVRVLRTGRAELVARVTGEWGALIPPEAVQPVVSRFAPYASYCAAPLVVRDQAIGAILLMTSVSGRHYDAEDLRLAEELAHHVAAAVDNAWLYREAQQAARAREQFLFIASHELRTPVTVVQGYIQNLLRVIDRQVSEAISQGRVRPPALATFDRERLVATLLRMQLAVRRLTKLIEDLLDVSHVLQDQRLQLKPERVDLAALLAEVADEVGELQARGRSNPKVSIVMSVPPTPVWGTWDRARLAQVLYALLDNAAKYSPEGGTVRASLVLEGVGPVRQAHVMVRDLGIGIPPGQHDEVFQPFTRAANASARNYPGLGLGLTLAKELVEEHNGRIWAESAGAGQGSTFHVLLPAPED